MEKVLSFNLGRIKKHYLSLCLTNNFQTKVYKLAYLDGACMQVELIIG